MIVVDIDGVIADPTEELNYRLAKLGYETRPVDKWIEGPHWSDIYPDIPRGVIDELLADPLTIKNAMAIEKSWYWVNHMSASHDIMFLTARDPVVTNQTWGWFFDWDLPADFIVFEKNKIDFLETIKDHVYAFVDDFPDTAVRAYDVGLNAFLMNRPYNVNADVDDKIRIDSLWEVTLRIR